MLEQEIDIVYTWVNGTDPAFQHSFSQYQKLTPAALRRLRDYNLLQFSVRSIEKFAPWARRIIIVTNGQIPTWADTSNPKYGEDYCDLLCLIVFFFLKIEDCHPQRTFP